MADYVSQVIKIEMNDAGGSKSTFKIENPLNNLTLAKVREVFADQYDSSTAVIESANTGDLFVGVAGAYYEVVTRTNLS